MYFFARTKNVAIVKTKFEWDMSNCIAMYTSHLFYFTYSIEIKIIITGKHVLNEAPLTWLWMVFITHSQKSYLLVRTLQ